MRLHAPTPLYGLCGCQSSYINAPDNSSNINGASLTIKEVQKKQCDDETLSKVELLERLWQVITDFRYKLQLLSRYVMFPKRRSGLRHVKLDSFVSRTLYSSAAPGAHFNEFGKKE